MSNEAELDAQARGLAISLVQEGKSPAEVWEALVASGVEGGAAQAIVTELLQSHAAEQPPSPGVDIQNDTAFCAACRADNYFSRDEDTFLDMMRLGTEVSTTNGTGRMFYGDAEECRSCRSSVRVLWYTLAGLPVFPIGCYRYQALSSGRPAPNGLGTVTPFVARRVKTRWTQIMIHWLAAPVVVAVAVVLIKIIESMR